MRKELQMDNNKNMEEKTPFVDEENQYGVKIQSKPASMILL